MSSPEHGPKTNLPPALPSMWRLVVLGHRHEPRLILAAFLLALLSALPDALIAVWLALLGQGVIEGRPALVTGRGDRHRAVGGGDVVPRDGLDAGAAPLPRQVTIALESHVAPLQASIATIAHHERPELPRPALGAARPGLRARPPLPVAVLDLRLDPAARRSRSRCWSRSTRRWRCWRFAALPTVVSSAWRPAVERAAQERGAPHAAAGRAPLPDGHDRAAGQGGARPGHRPDARRAPAGGLGALVRAGGRGAPGLGGVARARVGACSPSPTSGASSSSPQGLQVPAASVLLVLAAGARLSAYVGAPRSARSASCAASGWTGRGAWRGWRTTRPRWSPARTRTSAGAAARRASRSRGCRSPTRAPTRKVLRGRRPHPAGRRRGRPRRRERRRQDHAGQAAVEALRADRGAHPGRRAGPGPDRRRGVAQRGWRVPTRTSCASSCGRGRPSAWATSRAWTTSRRSWRRSAGPAPQDVVAGLPGRDWRRSWARPGPTASR